MNRRGINRKNALMKAAAQGCRSLPVERRHAVAECHPGNQFRDEALHHDCTSKAAAKRFWQAEA
jgi:hypothetical protein